MIQIGRYNFDGPWSLSQSDFIDRAVVYVVLCRTTDGYSVVYVGETGQLGTRLSTHNKYQCWKNNCSTSLWVAIFWTPTDRYTQEDRRKIESELINQYDPPCNK